MAIRFAFDLGTNSLGWTVLQVGGDGLPCGLIDLGVRLFSNGREPKTQAPLNDARRLARSARRRRDRLLLRKADFMKGLVEAGLMPADEAARKALESLDPYLLRRQGLDEALTLFELGRALFHLAQRRGFRSNRKADPVDDDDQGKIRMAVDATRRMMEEGGARTLGEFLAQRHEKREWVRARLRGDGARANYAFYASRDAIAAEFDALWSSQERFQALCPEARDHLRGILLRQRELRPPVVGFCSLEHGDERGPWALPVAQRFRILKELANLEVGAPGQPKRRLTTAERDILLERLLRSPKVSFDAMRKALRLESSQRFNLEGDKRTDLTGDETGTRLAHKDGFGKVWHILSLANQMEVVERLLEDEDEDALVSWLYDRHGLTEAAARKVARTTLPKGHCRFGRVVLADLVPIMQAEAEEDVDSDGVVRSVPLREDKAIARLGYHHSDRRRDTGMPRLPYYGEILEHHLAGSGDVREPPEERWGRLPNPTVHIGLNQLRKVVNALIKEYGRPDQIVVELARELKQSRKDREKATSEQKKNQDRNDRHRRELAEMGLPDTGENRLRLRLWEELSKDVTRRCCVYSGKVISKAMLFSPEVEVEHILPFRRTLDNSPANKTVSLREWNRLKGNLAPWEAFHGRPEWPDTLARAQDLPGNKRWRFEPDAMDRFEAGDRDFLDRQLTDTQYMGRLALEYLRSLYDRDEGDRVWVTPGRLTALLRGKWGLDGLLSDHNRKNRFDHRHHAIDAFVIGCTDRGMLNRVARAADQGRERLIEDMPEPWSGFREALRDRLATMVVSHKAEHGVQGRLHEDTAYGLVRNPAAEGGCNLVYRKPVVQLTEGEVEAVRDAGLRAKLQAWLTEASAQGLPFKQAIARFPQESKARYGEPNEVHRVRLVKTQAAAHPIRDASGRAYKAVIAKEAHAIEIFEHEGKWQGEVLSVLAANRGERTRWRTLFPEARPIMVLHKGDLIETEVDGTRQLVIVVSLNATKNRVYAVLHHEGGEFTKRNKDPDDQFAWSGWRLLTFTRMQETHSRRVRIDSIGRVRPVPPPE